jgi:flagellar motor switch protein FliN
MSFIVKKVDLPEQQSQMEHSASNKNYFDFVNHLEVECMVRIGTLNLTIAQLKEIKLGQVLPLQQYTNEPVDLLLQDKVIARGELMVHEQQFAIQITQVCLNV